MSAPVEPGNDPDFRIQGRSPSGNRIKRLLFGPAKDLSDRRIFHRLSVIAFLAWVGLGADGLSSSAYGPEEAFRTLGEHTYLAVILAAVMTLTISIIAIAYSRVIEHFPHGGGGYVVATALLGERAGVISGSALLVDYVLTITVSIAAAGDALFSFLPPGWHSLKFPVEVFLILALTTLNIRGVKESILVLLPVFLLFLLTHIILVGGGLVAHASHFPEVTHEVQRGFSAGMTTLGFGGMLLLFLRAYSLGGGTYTGIEAVSNGLLIMREPRVETGRRTMLYMASSLAATASGLIVCYLIWGVTPVEGKTMNAVLVEKFVEVVPLGDVFIILTLISEGALLVVAAQAGFVDGPRVLANMAVDSWVPRQFSTLSEQLTTRNGIILMGAAALAALLYTGGDVRQLVIMYSINVFLTFSMTELGMCRFWFGGRHRQPDWKRKISIHITGLMMCVTIFVVIVYEKFGAGGWMTLLVTGLVVVICFAIRRHYRKVADQLSELNRDFAGMPTEGISMPTVELAPGEPTAAVLVSGYSGLGIQTLLNVLDIFPREFRNVVFLSVGVVDSGEMKGGERIKQLGDQTVESLEKYVKLAAYLDLPATYKMTIGTDVVDGVLALCRETAREFPMVTFFAGQLIFQRESWLHRLLHNQTAFSVQRRLLFEGKTMVILPVYLR